LIQHGVGYRAYSLDYYQITENSPHCLGWPKCPNALPRYHNRDTQLPTEDVHIFRPEPLRPRFFLLEYSEPRRGDYLMGRSFESVRMGVKELSRRWLKTSRCLMKEDQVYGLKLVEFARKYSSEAFYALDDPSEAALFSVLVELLKKIGENSGSIAPTTENVQNKIYFASKDNRRATCCFNEHDRSN